MRCFILDIAFDNRLSWHGRIISYKVDKDCLFNLNESITAMKPYEKNYNAWAFNFVQVVLKL